MGRVRDGKVTWTSLFLCEIDDIIKEIGSKVVEITSETYNGMVVGMTIVIGMVLKVLEQQQNGV